MERRRLIPINITIDEDLVSELNVLCEKLDTDRSKFIRHAIRFYLKALEDHAEVDFPEKILRLG